MVLATAGVLLKDRMVEEWYLHKLEHGDQTERQAAAEKLGEMGSNSGSRRWFGLSPLR